jgi:hypothetical protein
VDNHRLLTRYFELNIFKVTKNHLVMQFNVRVLVDEPRNVYETKLQKSKFHFVALGETHGTFCTLKQ